MDKDRNTHVYHDSNSDADASMLNDNKSRGNSQNEFGQSVESTYSEETVINNNPAETMSGTVQQHGWNNGKPQVTKEQVEELHSHVDDTQKTADQLNDEDLRKNKGNHDDEPVFEASEEVNTGQNSG